MSKGGQTWLAFLSLASGNSKGMTNSRGARTPTTRSPANSIPKVRRKAQRETDSQSSRKLCRVAVPADKAEFRTASSSSVPTAIVAGSASDTSAPSSPSRPRLTTRRFSFYKVQGGHRSARPLFSRCARGCETASADSELGVHFVVLLLERSVLSDQLVVRLLQTIVQLREVRIVLLESLEVLQKPRTHIVVELTSNEVAPVVLGLHLTLVSRLPILARCELVSAFALSHAASLSQRYSIDEIKVSQFIP